MVRAAYTEEMLQSLKIRIKIKFVTFGPPCNKLKRCVQKKCENCILYQSPIYSNNQDAACQQNSGTLGVQGVTYKTGQTSPACSTN